MTDVAVLTIPIDVHTALELLTTEHRAVEFIAQAPGVEIRITVGSEIAIASAEAIDPPPPALPTGPDDDMHVCPECRRTFDTDHGLKVHTARTHPKPTRPAEPAPAREIRCEPCGRAFETPQALGAHRRRDHPAKPQPQRKVQTVAQAERDRPALAAVTPPMERRPFDPQAARNAAAAAAFTEEVG